MLGLLRIRTLTFLALSTRNTNDEKRTSTYFLKDGSYLKLRTIELGYTFPESMVKKAMISRLRAYVSANNVFTIKKWWDSNRFSGPLILKSVTLAMSFHLPLQSELI